MKNLPFKHLSLPFENIGDLPFEIIITTLSKTLSSSNGLWKHYFETFNNYSFRNHFGVPFNITKGHKRTEAKALPSKASLLSKRKRMVSKQPLSKVLRRQLQIKSLKAPFWMHGFERYKCRQHGLVQSGYPFESFILKQKVGNYIESSFLNKGKLIKSKANSNPFESIIYKQK